MFQWLQVHLRGTVITKLGRLSEPYFFNRILVQFKVSFFQIKAIIKKNSDLITTKSAGRESGPNPTAHAQ